MNDKRQVVIPANNSSVWHPLKNRPLKDDGEAVNWSSYWARRLKDESITLGSGPIAESIKAQDAAREKRAKKRAQAAASLKKAEKGGNK